ncbi:MAG TPA: PfkB family carbohydrate kinase [Solirubrobacteraceae bacterium]|nr:PfkB family carbohydrate kinase [Solirubrobacteraceae bacterium]
MTDDLPTGSLNVLCLGEALVDMICERPVAALEQADMFVPHFGGTVANVALMAARAGARTALAGGAGDDPWGHWLRRQLERAGVDLDHFKLIPEMRTPLALTTVSAAGEPSYTLYGDVLATVVNSLRGRVEQAVEASGGLFISSNTLVGEAEREITMRAREHALALGQPVIFDPNLRVHRWASRGEAAASINACVPGALLVRLNAEEARLITREDDLERAAMAIRKAGARNVVISDGPHGAILRGKIRLDVPGVPARVISTIGAGDALMATLLARLQITGFYEPAIAAALKQAMIVAAEACERWGACD